MADIKFPCGCRVQTFIECRDYHPPLPFFSAILSPDWANGMAPVVEKNSISDPAAHERGDEFLQKRPPARTLCTTWRIQLASTTPAKKNKKHAGIVRCPLHTGKNCGTYGLMYTDTLPGRNGDSSASNRNTETPFFAAIKARKSRFFLLGEALNKSACEGKRGIE